MEQNFSSIISSMFESKTSIVKNIAKRSHIIIPTSRKWQDEANGWTRWQKPGVDRIEEMRCDESWKKKTNETTHARTKMKQSDDKKKLMEKNMRNCNRRWWSGGWGAASRGWERNDVNIELRSTLAFIRFLCLYLPQVYWTHCQLYDPETKTGE